MASKHQAHGRFPFNIPQSQGIRVVSNCPICGSRYKSEQTKVLEERGDAHLIHVQCQRCRGSVVAVIVRSPIGLNSVGLVTDLTADDVLKFKDNAAITENDCLQIHQILEC